VRIYRLNGRAEIWLDRIGHTTTEPTHGDRLSRTIAALEDIELVANAKASIVAGCRAKINAALLPFDL
jgi:hypothetical protein